MKYLLKKNYILWFGLILLILPILINLLVLSWGTTITFGEINSWLGFFGSYLGSIAGGLLTLIGVVITIDSQKKDLKQEQVVKTQKLLLLLTEEVAENLTIIKSFDNMLWDDKREDNIILGKESFLEHITWKQMKSDSLLLLNADTLIQLLKLYELIEKYNDNAGKDKNEVLNLKSSLNQVKKKLEDEYQSL